MGEFLNRFSLTERALAAAFVVSLMMLISAHLFEHVGGLEPCALCLDQREAHWAGLAVSGIGLVIALVFRARLGAAASVGAAALVYAVSAALAFYHTGVEFKFWPGPAACAGGGGTIDVTDLLSAVNGEFETPSCADVPWTLFGISMAGYNFIGSLGLFAFALLASMAEVHQARRGRKHGATRSAPSDNR